jgi:hypothetical protein
MTHITEITPTLKQNTAHRTTQAIKDDVILDVGDKKCTQNFGGKIYWKTAT